MGRRRTGRATRNVICAALLAGLSALPQNGRAQSQAGTPPDLSGTYTPPDLSGTYKCGPNPNPCAWSGAGASISQSGNKLQIKSDNDAAADALLTSDITISAGGTFNSLGIVRPDHSIDWSDGTKWTRQ